ncbi:MAG TPA: GDSL-type esterase/lipase family protein [Bacteroidales bacterium]|nr:GDSL-type esterase/lipase family protein [Bacteroidales bacterium]
MIRHLVSIIFLLIISCSPIRKYQALPEVRAWETDIQQFEQLDNSETYQKDAILFAGSSSIRLWSTLEQDMAPYPIIQRGYGGAKLSDFVVYASRIFNPHPCRAIVIFIANDISGSDQDKSPQEVAGLFRNLLKTIRKTHPQTPVFWIAITPTASRWKVWPQIEKANNLIKDICDNQFDTYFIRTDFAFLNEASQPIDNLFRSDRLHLTEKGYAVWTNIIKNEIKKIVPIAEVEIIAHRGASFLAPENTVASKSRPVRLDSR